MKKKINKDVAFASLSLVVGILLQRYFLNESDLKLNNAEYPALSQIIHIVSFGFLCLSVFFNIKVLIKHRKRQSC